jgi:hypothetical protein
MHLTKWVTNKLYPIYDFSCKVLKKAAEALENNGANSDSFSDLSESLRDAIKKDKQGHNISMKKKLIGLTAGLLILGLAIFLRARRLDTTPFWTDQAITLSTAMRWINGGPIPLAANKSSAGSINPPMIEYLFAAALCIWPDVLSVAIMTMIAGIVAVAATGWTTYRLFGQRAAIWTALLFAVNPLGVLYSQQIWNQTMVPVFSSLMLGCLLLYFATKQQNPVYLLLSFVWAACMTQVHPGTIVQLPTMGLICALFWRKLKVWPLIVGVAIFALLYVPFILYESAVGWTDIIAIWELAHKPAPFSIASLLVSFDLMHATGLLSSIRSTVQFDNLATALLMFSLLYTLGMCMRGFLRKHRNSQVEQNVIGMFIMLLWFALPILSYLRSAHYLQAYYLISQWPAHFMLIGTSLDGLQRILEQATKFFEHQRWQCMLNIAARALLPIPLLLLIGWQIWFNIQHQNHRFRAQTDRAQIRHIRTVIRQSKQLLAEYPACDLVAVSKGHNFEISELSLLVEFTSPERVLLTDGRLALPIPKPCAIYLDALPGSQGSNWLSSTATPLPDTSIKASGETWQFYELPTDAQTDLVKEASLQSPIAKWKNNIALIDYTRDDTTLGSTLPLTLTWTVETQPPEIVYHLGTYLLTMDKQIVAQSDGPGFDSIQWHDGDQFVTWSELLVPPDLEPGDYQIAVAWYTWPKLKRIALSTGENTAFLEKVHIPTTGTD